MGLTERHWFENEDVPENYEWDLEDAVYNSRANKKHDDDIDRCKDCKRKGTYDCPIYDGVFVSSVLMGKGGEVV